MLESKELFLLSKLDLDPFIGVAPFPENLFRSLFMVSLSGACGLGCSQTQCRVPTRTY